MCARHYVRSKEIHMCVYDRGHLRLISKLQGNEVGQIILTFPHIHSIVKLLLEKLNLSSIDPRAACMSNLAVRRALLRLHVFIRKRVYCLSFLMSLGDV